TAFAFFSYRAFRPAGFAYCRACLVFQSAHRHRLLVGVFPAAKKISRRCGQVCAHLRPHDRVFCPGHGAIPTSLPRALSTNATPTPALNRSKGPAACFAHGTQAMMRSEERRVGKECRALSARDDERKEERY